MERTEIFVLNSLGNVAQIVAALASVAALLIAWQANQLAKWTRDESREQNEKSHQLAEKAAEDSREFAHRSEERERLRDQREVASNMQAWWVCNKTAEGKQWGIFLSTSGTVNSVFFEVELTVLDKGTTLTKTIAMLPPGQYFVKSEIESESNRKEHVWLRNPRPLESGEMENCKPLLQAEKYAVEKIQFRDQLGQKWLWSRQVGLTSVEA